MKNYGEKMGILDNMFSFLKEEKKPEQVVNTVIINDIELGTSGTEISSGYYDEEYLETLNGKDRACIYDQMRRSDSQVKMLIGATNGPIKTAPREINAASDDIEHKKHAALCRQVMFEDIKTNKFINESLTLTIFGNSIFERVHSKNIDKPFNDEDGNLVLNSYIGFKKLAWRSPKTIETFNYVDKEFASITQQADGDLDSYVDIGKEHLVIMVLDEEGDNLEGISMLRACYGNYFRKNDYLKKNAVNIEKSMPIPTAEVPSGKENSPQFDQLTIALEKFTSHQKNYLIYPEGWNVNLSNGTNYDPSKIEMSIDNEDKRMAKAFLANFLNLGMSGGGGSYSLSNDLSDFFLLSIEHIAKIIEEAIDGLLKELVILNFGEQDKYPTFKFTGIKDKAGEEFAKILDLLVKNKIIIPDDNLEDHARKRLNLTVKSEDGQREVAGQTMPGATEPLTLSEKINFAIKEKRKTLGED